MRSFWYITWWDWSTHVTWSWAAKFFNPKFQHRLSPTNCVGGMMIFGAKGGFRVWSFILTGQNRFLKTLQISGFIVALCQSSLKGQMSIYWHFVAWGLTYHLNLFSKIALENIIVMRNKYTFGLRSDFAVKKDKWGS